MDEPMDINKRHFKRFGTESTALRCRILYGIGVEVIDLSAEGAFLKVDDCLGVNSEYEFSLEHEGKSISARGVVVSEEPARPSPVKKGRAAELYLANFKFTGTTDTSGLADLIDLCGTRSLRGSMRVPGTTGLDCGQSVGGCRVRQISFGGMQIEAPSRVEPDSRVHVEVEFPEDARRVKVVGRVASCKEAENGYTLGIEYLEMDNSDLLKLKDFIYAIEGL